MRHQLLCIVLALSSSAFCCDKTIKLYGEVVFSSPKAVSEVGEFADYWSENDSRYGSILLDSKSEAKEVLLIISKGKNKVKITQKTSEQKINGKNYYKIDKVNFYADIANRSITYPYSMQVKFKRGKIEYCSKKIQLRGEG